jgi:hypothetical protein
MAQSAAVRIVVQDPYCARRTYTPSISLSLLAFRTMCSHILSLMLVHFLSFLSLSRSVSYYWSSNDTERVVAVQN